MTRIAFALMAVLACAAPAAAHVEVPGLDLNGQCVGDKDGDSQVTVSELVTAVNNALNGCERLPITLSFHGMVGDQDFACGTVYNGIGTGLSQYIPSDFRFYVSNVKLLTIAGEEVPLDMDSDGVWQVSQDGQSVAMIDFETGPDNGCNDGNSATNTEVHGTVPAGVYTGVKFDLGLPFAINHRDVSTAPSPLNFSAMFWSWNGGYRFLKIDTGDDKFRVHLGSTGCNGGSPSRPPTSCDHPNLPTISLTGFNPSHSVIVADIAALLADNNIDTNVPETPPGCASDPNDTDCVPVFSHLGLNFADGSASPATQSFFRIAAEEHGSEHVEIKVASAADGSGALVAHPEFDTDEPIPLPASACLGGTGDECTGGTRIFTAVNPGIEPLAESEPDESIYKLPDSVQVTLEATALDPALMVRLGDQVIDAVGKTIVLGMTPDFHADLETDLSLPGGGAPSGTYSATFKLTTTSSQYQSSETFTLKFTPTEAPHQ